MQLPANSQISGHFVWSYVQSIAKRTLILYTGLIMAFQSNLEMTSQTCLDVMPWHIENLIPLLSLFHEPTGPS